MTLNNNEGTVIASTTRRNATSSAAKPPINNNGSSQDGHNKKKMKTTAKNKKKKESSSGAFGIFKAALFMLRKKNGDKPSKKTIAKQDVAPPATANPNWTKLVDSMRPLHLQETPESPPADLSGERAVVARTEEIFFAPPSPAASSSTVGTLSRYASAQSLRDLYNMSSDDEDEDDEEEEEEDPDAMFDALCGDEMIDTKAEEFIARFYRQIKLQNSVSSHHH